MQQALKEELRRPDMLVLHLFEMAGWMQGMLSLGGYEGPTHDVASSYGRLALWEMILTPGEKRDPVVMRMSGGDKRRGPFKNLTVASQALHELATHARHAERTVASGDEQVAWDSLMRANRLRGGLEFLFRIAQADGGPALQAKVAKKGGEAAKKKKDDGNLGRARAHAVQECERLRRSNPRISNQRVGWLLAPNLKATHQIDVRPETIAKWLPKRNQK